MYEIKQLSELGKNETEETIRIFMEGFRHLFSSFKDDVELEQLLLGGMDHSLVYVYMDHGKVLGCLGLGTNQKRTFHFSAEHCSEIFGGFKGKLIARQLNMILAKPAVKNDTDLYIDILTTTAQSRGEGIGTKLLEFAFSLPGYEECYIEVLSKNINAKRLYESIGFLPYKKSFNIFTNLNGHGSPIKMKKSLTNPK